MDSVVNDPKYINILKSYIKKIQDVENYVFYLYLWFSLFQYCQYFSISVLSMFLKWHNQQKSYYLELEIATVVS